MDGKGPIPFRPLLLFRHCYCVYFNRPLLRQTFVPWVDDVDCDYGKKKGKVIHTYINLLSPTPRIKLKLYWIINNVTETTDWSLTHPTSNCHFR